jgi:CBS domain-containing protein
MLRARDVMNKDIVSVKKDTPIHEAVNLMVENDISGLPVVKDDMTLTGVLSEKDVVTLFYDNKEAENKTVNDYMTYPAVCFEENEALLDVCDFFARNIFRRVPITSQGKLVGIISVRDILKSILQLRQGEVASTN